MTQDFMDTICRDLLPTILSLVKSDDAAAVDNIARSSPDVLLEFLKTRGMVRVNTHGLPKTRLGLQLAWLAKHRAEQFTQLDIAVECGFRDTFYARNHAERPIPGAIAMHAKTWIVNGAYGYGRRTRQDPPAFKLPPLAKPDTAIFQYRSLADWSRVFGIPMISDIVAHVGGIHVMLVDPDVPQYPFVKRFYYDGPSFSLVWDRVIHAWFPNAEISRGVPAELTEALVVHV